MTVERALPCSEVNGRTESVVITSWPSYVVGIEFTKDHNCVAVELCAVQDLEMAVTVLYCYELNDFQLSALALPPVL